MLTEEETAQLRANVRRAASDQSSGSWFRYADGPLSGLLVRLKPDEMGYRHGWCQTTRTGAVLVNYKADAKTRRCCFDEYTQPGREPPTWWSLRPK